MNISPTRLLLPIVAVVTLALGGCIVAPENGYGYDGYYAAPPAVIAPAPYIGGGWGYGWGGGWGHDYGGGWGRGGRR